MRIERTLDRGSVHRWADTCPGETPFRGTVYIAVEGGGVPDGELELIQRSLNGDLEAWGEIVSRYKEAAFGIAVAILRNRADAEDAVQDAFVRAYERLDRYDLSRKFSTWLFTVTANVAKNALRKRRRDPLPKEVWAEDPARMVWQEEMEQSVREAVWGLPESYRAPLVLRYWHDLPLEEIGDVLGLRLGTVKTRLHRARALVRAELAARGVIRDAVG
jgi:RNA polymerase sigma-70 factor (ECF subfamily)